MKSSAPTVQMYLDELPEDRREMVAGTPPDELIARHEAARAGTSTD